MKPRPLKDLVARESPSQTGRRTLLDRNISIRSGRKPESATTTLVAAPESAPNAKTPLSSDNNRPAAEPIVQRPAPVVTAIEPPPRCGTAFSEAQTLVRENSGRSRNSTAKMLFPPGDDEGVG